MPNSAVSEVSVPRVCQPDHGLPTNTEEVLSEVESRADPRLWLARHGVPCVYRVDTEDETFFFEVWSRYIFEQGRRDIRVFPISYWKDGVREDYIAPRHKGERQAHLPSCILFGKFDLERIPEDLREDLGFWAEICLDGVKRYDEERKRDRNRRNH